MPAATGRFQQLSSLTARWCHEDGPGSEHLTLERHGERITATAVVTSADAEKPYAAWYQIFLDDRWRVKAVSVHRTDSRWFIARSPQPGSWCDGDGSALDKLDGCRDIALLDTRFAITPLIRRLNLAAGDAKECDVVALSLETLVPARRRQRISCLKPASSYRLEDLNNGAAQDIRVDDDGLIHLAAQGISRVI